MDCPVCKYPNPQGVTYCGMCYEVFNRSAAESYMRAVKRERRSTAKASDSDSVLSGPGTIDKTVEVFQRVDWTGLRNSVVSLLSRSRNVILIAGSLVLFWCTISFLFSASLWYHLLGKNLSYAFPSGESTAYMVGITQKYRSWSERGGRLDTPLEDYQVEELGNVLLSREKSSSKNQSVLRLRAKEWIQVLHDARESSNGIPLSHAIPLNHPSLAAARLRLDKKGYLAERRAAATPRIGKTAVFLTPWLPTGRIRRGRTWTERVEWMDVFNEWKIHWVGTLLWTAGELEPCSDGRCVRLTYQATVQPQLWEAPSWASKGVRYAQSQMSTEGLALFDVTHHRLASNTFSYDGLLHIPIRDLGLIPRDLRVGRRVKKTAGEIVIRFENKIDLHKN